jgi:HAE1 family hydrophobic/amphiphilic exporter-1
MIFLTGKNFHRQPTPENRMHIMNLTEFSLQRPVTTVMVFLCISVIGVISFFLLPIEYFPDLDAPFIAVEVPYPNSTPEEVERQITRPIEEVLATIGDIKTMGSWSSENQANIWCEFEWGINTDLKALKAREKVDGIRNQLPNDIERYYIHKWNTADEEILALRLSSNRDLSDSYDMLDRNVKRRLERIDGVSRVTLYGVEKKEIRIQLDMNRLAAYHVDINRLVQTLMHSNFAVTAGKINDGARRLSVRPMGEFTTISDYENLVIGQHNLHLADVAVISYDDPKLEYGRHLDQKYAVGLDIFKESGANTVDVSKKILAEIDLIGELPEMEGITIYEMENQAHGIISSLSELFKSGLLGAFLAIVVLYFFLRRWATTIIVTLAVPFSLLVALASMYFLGISLNILSMMGLLLAIGMLVDNAVVATESIHRYQENNPDVVSATLSGVREISLAITAGTFTTVIVFLPQILSTSDEIAIFLKHISIALCISLLASLMIAQTIVPLCASRLKPYKPKFQSKDIERLTNFYQRVLTWTLNHPRWTSLFIILTLFSIMIPTQFVKFDMFPDQDSNRKLRLHYNINDTYTVKQVENVVDQVEGYLFANKEKFEINSIYTYYQADYAMSTILLNQEEHADTPQEEIMKMIREGLPPIAIGSPSFERSRGRGSEGGIQIQLIGKSSEELVTLSKEVAWTLSQIPGLVDVRSEAEAGEKEIHVVVDRERSRLYGFDRSRMSCRRPCVV